MCLAIFAPGSDESDFVNKAVVLIKRKFDVNCRNCNGATLIHEVLVATHCYGVGSTARETIKLLILFISAGVDVYAKDSRGQTATMLARRRGRLWGWTEALLYCGFDPDNVFAASDDDSVGERQVSKLSFDDCCAVLQPSKQSWKDIPDWEEIPFEEDHGYYDNYCGGGGCRICFKSCGSQCKRRYPFEVRDQSDGVSNLQQDPTNTASQEATLGLNDSSNLEFEDPPLHPAFYSREVFDDPVSYEAGFVLEGMDHTGGETRFIDHDLNTEDILYTLNSPGWVM
jgi:hypothetical protein